MKTFHMFESVNFSRCIFSLSLFCECFYRVSYTVASYSYNILYIHADKLRFCMCVSVVIVIDSSNMFDSVQLIELRTSC